MIDGSTHTPIPSTPTSKYPGPMTMSKSNISRAVDQWTCQAVSATRYLVRLYRTLDDERQAITANLAMGTCDERATRQNVRAQIEVFDCQFRDSSSSETVDVTGDEERAWTLLVESQAGLWAFLGLIEDPEQARSLRGLRTSTTKALHQALKGIRVAFPEDMATTAASRALLAATDRCVEAFAMDLENRAEGETEGFRRDLHVRVLGAMTREAELHGAPNQP